MRLCVDGLSALRALRVFRREGRTLGTDRMSLPTPDPSPQQRWSARAVPFERLALSAPPSAASPVDVVVPRPELRLRGKFFSCVVRSTSVPDASFASLGEGLYIPCPELLFLELAGVMSTEALALLGYELCGTYARDADDPRLGSVIYDLAPVTTVERISAYLEKFRDRPLALLARHALRNVANNAWSPSEAIVGLFACLPVRELGFQMGSIALNVRHGATPELVALGCRESRVPDIEVVGTHVGFNYDSQLHLDLESIADAAAIGDASEQIATVRRKYHDDLSRNRELAAMGRVILPVTATDLFAPGGLDAVMLEAAMTIDELDGGPALSNARVALSPLHLARRQVLLWSLLPWSAGVHYAHEAAAWKPWKPGPAPNVRSGNDISVHF